MIVRSGTCQGYELVILGVVLPRRKLQVTRLLLGTAGRSSEIRQVFHLFGMFGNLFVLWFGIVVVVWCRPFSAVRVTHAYGNWYTLILCCFVSCGWYTA